MFRLRVAYALFSFAALALFNVLFLTHRIPYAFINILFLLIAPMGYIYPDLFSYVLGSASWAILYPVFIFLYKIDPLNAALTLLLFNLLQFGFIECRNIIRQDRKSWDRRLKGIEEEAKMRSEEFERLADIENGIKDKELSTVNIYEVTKKMSEYLKFEDIFAAFSQLIKEHFTFRRCDLLILGWEEKKARLDRIYSVWQEGILAPSGHKVDYNKLIDFVLEGNKESYLSKANDPAVFKGLSIEDGEVTTFITIPLFSEKKVVAILALENLAKSEVDRFIILSMQFALEINKVLLYEMVEKMAITDSLTGLYVRRYFLERLQEELQRSKRYKFKFAFLMVDIDDFKLCNDTHGHLVGDVILKEMGRILKESVREIDLISRYGGEEFALVLPESGMEGAMLAAERIRKKVEDNLFKAYDEKVRITVSIGISVYPEDSKDKRGIIENSDSALYVAKKSGKNVVSYYKK